MKKTIVIVTLFLSCFLTFISISPLASAAENQIRLSASGLKYMTGGIGHDEVEVMRRYAKQFSLNILFSEGEIGISVEGANLVIFDSEGKAVFRIKKAKPVLYVDVPVGEYWILASQNGLKQGVKVSVKNSTNQKIILNWKDAVEEDKLIGNE